MTKTHLIKIISTAVLFLLAGCSFSPSQPPAPIKETAPPVVTPPVKPEPPPSVSEALPQPPKIQTMNWRVPLQPLVQQLLAVPSIPSGSLLFINAPQNQTNGTISTVNISQALLALLQHNALFALVPANQVMQAKQALGIAADDVLGTRSKAMALARYLQAPYLLYSQVQGNHASPTIQMQLMLVNTGEILWTGNQAVVAP